MCVCVYIYIFCMMKLVNDGDSCRALLASNCTEFNHGPTYDIGPWFNSPRCGHLSVAKTLTTWHTRLGN